MRKNIVKRGLVAAAAVALTVGLAAGAAQADPPFTPDANDIVGVGSDTSQIVVDELGDGRTASPVVAGYNAGADGVAGTTDDPARRLASFDAIGSATITIRPGVTINRPNGSSAGINALLANTNLSFARSSRSITAAEAAAPNNLRQYPFARDGLRVVGNVAQSGSPASLTVAQLVNIYECDATADQWSDVGGASTATIHPKLPQSGSGTRQFFLDQLTAANGGVPITLGACVDDTVQEHDPSPVLNDVDSLAPFSTGRLSLLPAAQQDQIKVFGGFTPSRVLYNVVRLASTSDAGFTAIFGPTGYICSTAGQQIVQANGLLSLTSGCGIPRTTPLP